MTNEETLTILYEYDSGDGVHWQLSDPLPDDPYSISMYYPCKTCIAWDIMYRSSDVIDSVLHFLDTNSERVPIGLRIDANPDDELSLCTLKEALEVYEEGVLSL